MGKKKKYRYSILIFKGILHFNYKNFGTDINVGTKIFNPIDSMGLNKISIYFFIIKLYPFKGSLADK